MDSVFIVKKGGDDTNDFERQFVKESRPMPSIVGSHGDCKKTAVVNFRESYSLSESESWVRVAAIRSASEGLKARR